MNQASFSSSLSLNHGKSKGKENEKKNAEEKKSFFMQMYVFSLPFPPTFLDPKGALEISNISKIAFMITLESPSI